MLRIERQQKCFTRLEQPKLVEVSITERYDLQEFIFNSPEQFFAEIGQDLFVIGKEINPSELTQDRIDLLALDPAGRAVIVELKRGNDKLQLLQAIAYAGMIAKWKPEDFLSRLNAERQEKLATNFLTVRTEEINREQRLILIAEAYDYEVLVGAEWLHDNFEISVLCCRIALSSDPISKSEYLSCTPVFPAPELALQAVPKRRGSTQGVAWADWNTALANVSNRAMAEYYKSQVEAGREGNLPDRCLMYRVEGKRRWYLSVRDKWAYGWQDGRFEGDINFWSKRLSNKQSVKEVQERTSLSFCPSTAEDFAAFHSAVTQELLPVVWLQAPAVEQDGEEDAAIGNAAGSN